MDLPIITCYDFILRYLPHYNLLYRMSQQYLANLLT